jgi:spore coat polysaccharide biosynthesis protein SpsF
VTEETPQLKLWSGEFGYEYSKRSGNALTDQNMRRLRRNWGTMLSRALSPAPQSVLEVGANIGRNLMALSGLVPQLHAVEPNVKCCEEMRTNPKLGGATIHQGNAFSLPYDANAIDLVFTSGVLIHVSPETLLEATSEIVRVARHYVLCIEYFSHDPMSVRYRDLGEGYLFKRDFGGWYLDHYPELKVVDYGFLWERVDSGDDLNWWLFRK